MPHSSRVGVALVSAIVPTRDEEDNIAECLDSLLCWLDDVVVLDSYSTDRTVDLARSAGARVVCRAFDNFSAHKNWALDNVQLEHDWVLFVDADERITPALAAEIRAKVPDAPKTCDGYYIPRKTWFRGRWMRSMYPDYNLRLIRRGKGRYEDRIVHEHVVVDGSAEYLENPLIHRDEKGIERWLDRHNRYSSMEAFETWRTRHGHPAERSIEANLAVRGPQRQRFLKQFAHRFLPCRPLIHFLYHFFVKGAVLDGRRGFQYSLLRAFYEYQVSLKLQELAESGSPLRRKYEDMLP